MYTYRYRYSMYIACIPQHRERQSKRYRKEEDGKKSFPLSVICLSRVTGHFVEKMRDDEMLLLPPPSPSIYLLGINIPSAIPSGNSDAVHSTRGADIAPIDSLVNATISRYTPDLNAKGDRKNYSGSIMQPPPDILGLGSGSVLPPSSSTPQPSAQHKNELQSQAQQRTQAEASPGSNQVSTQPGSRSQV